MNLPEEFRVKEPSETALEPEDKWILFELNKTVKTVREGLDNYDLSKSAKALYEFFWDQYCDWYIEFTKERVYKGEEKSREAALNTLVYVLDRALKLLHPFMPYITEEIWHHLPTKEGKSISLARFPKENPLFEEFETSAREVEFVKKVISSVRNFKTTLDLSVGKKLKAYYLPKEEWVEALLEEFKNQILRLARLESLEKTDQRPEGTLVIPIEGGEIYISVVGEVDLNQLKLQQEKKKEKLLKELKRVEAKLNNPKFLERAPKEVVEKEKRIYEELKMELQKVEEVLKLIRS